MRPLVPKSATTTGYVNPIDYGVYAGFADSAILCAHPLQFWSTSISAMTSESYDCPESLLPIEYPNWNPKYYSPVCRDWYKDSKKA